MKRIRLIWFTLRYARRKARALPAEQRAEFYRNVARELREHKPPVDSDRASR